MKRRVNVGLIGHKFMGKAHSHGLKDVSMFFDLDITPVMKVLCGQGDDLSEVAEKYGWESCEQSWEKVVADPEIDVISIAAPGVLHKDIAIAAAKNGKHILCEKPLSNTIEESREMLKSVLDNHVAHMVNFIYRRVPAINLAKKLVSEGKLGEISHFKATYQQEWAASPDVPYLWRFDKEIAGAGSLADKGSHIVDLARYLVGEIEEVVSTSHIHIKQRPSLDDPAVLKTVTTDDAAAFIAKFANGTVGVFETSRISVGHKNALSFEINGSKGSILFNLEKLNELQVYLADNDRDIQGFRSIMVTEPEHMYIRNWWPSGHIIGWENMFIHQYYELFKSISRNLPPSPDFQDGLKAQEIIEAIIRSAEEKRWIKV